MNINRNKLLVYKDKGCFDISNLIESLNTYFPNYSVETINATEIIETKKLNSSVLALFISGGIANHYFENLGDNGNKKIREYVLNGGIYFGICAGAYYACRDVEFETEIPESSIRAKYKLDLINAFAKGTL